MNLERLFLNEMTSNPADPALRLVYADWLEERGRDQEAAFFRHLNPAQLYTRVVENDYGPAFGYGIGYGYGLPNGNGNGTGAVDGDAFDYGDGSGDGRGCGVFRLGGDQHGDGCGCGYGYGYLDGDGQGYGFGYGDNEGDGGGSYADDGGKRKHFGRLRILGASSDDQPPVTE
ncbi:MAG: TIGR02996 domain-containing protein [Planctomycetales bacterium]